MSALAPFNLHFEDSGDWHSLPDWAEYFINVGKQLSGAERATSRVVVAIAVPTRAYCAAFVSLGMVVSDAASRDRSSVAAHFEMLFDLRPGTPVIFSRPGRILKGVMLEPKEMGGKLCVGVQMHSPDGGGLTSWIDESQALRVQPARHSGKLPKQQNGENKRFANKFVDSLLGEVDPVQLGQRSKCVCSIVGKKNTLENEIRQTPIALYANGDYIAEGPLQDVLRVDHFVTGDQSHRSTLVPVGASLQVVEVSNEVEIGVVFDGAIGLLKWGTKWPSHHQVIILDRTEPNFDDAILSINSRFSQNRDKAGLTFAGSGVPPGGEILVFREAIP